MRPLQIVPFDPGQLDAAADLIAERQSRLIGLEPALPARYTDPVEVRPRLEEQLRSPGAMAKVALGPDGTLAGFLLGTTREGTPYGRSLWITLEGSDARDAETMRDLYADWARAALEAGYFRHYVEVPAGEPHLLDAWYRLGFARMHEYGLRETTTEDLAPAPGIHIRRATDADSAIIERFANVISRVQAQSPSYSPTTAEAAAGERADYLEELSGEDGWWLALDSEDDRPLGMSIFYPPPASLATPDGATYLGSTLVAAEERGRGVGRALLRFVLERGREAGARHCVTNWRTTNLLASRTWPALGFRTTHHRLTRALDPGLGEAGRASTGAAASV